MNPQRILPELVSDINTSVAEVLKISAMAILPCHMGGGWFTKADQPSSLTFFRDLSLFMSMQLLARLSMELLIQYRRLQIFVRNTTFGCTWM